MAAARPTRPGRRRRGRRREGAGDRPAGHIVLEHQIQKGSAGHRPDRRAGHGLGGPAPRRQGRPAAARAAGAPATPLRAGAPRGARKGAVRGRELHLLVHRNGSDRPPTGRVTGTTSNRAGPGRSPNREVRGPVRLEAAGSARRVGRGMGVDRAPERPAGTACSWLFWRAPVVRGRVASSYRCVSTKSARPRQMATAPAAVKDQLREFPTEPLSFGRRSGSAGS